MYAALPSCATVNADTVGTLVTETVDETDTAVVEIVGIEVTDEAVPEEVVASVVVPETVEVVDPEIDATLVVEIRLADEVALPDVVVDDDTELEAGATAASCEASDDWIACKAVLSIQVTSVLATLGKLLPKT